MANKKITNYLIMVCIIAAIALGLIFGDMSSYLGAFRVTEDGGLSTNSAAEGNVVQVLP